jgi:hypothetical protein
MSEASLSAQRLAVTAMRARAELTALVPAANIFDRHSRPESFPCIVVGEGQTVSDEATCLVAAEVHLTLHVWTRENSMTACKSIAGEVQRALRNLSGTLDGWACDFNFEDALYLRDPSGEHSHGVLTFTVLAEDIVAGVV